MKSAIVLAVCLVAATWAGPREKYTTKYDNINLDDLVHNDRLMESYVNCALNKGPCSPDGTELKRVLPDALQNGCLQCSETQRQGTKVIVRHLYKNKPQWWTALSNLYDKEGIYEKKYASQLRAL